jgi:hypothetical protein
LTASTCCHRSRCTVMSASCSRSSAVIASKEQ